MIEDETQDQGEENEGSSPHTSAEEGHPAGDGPRTDREVGGPVAEDDAEESTGGATSRRPDGGFEPHE